MTKNSKNGFTIVELAVTLTILAMLATLALPSFTSYKKQSSAEICKANREALMRVYETCEYLNCNSADVENSEGKTMTKFLTGGFPAYSSDIADYRCPDGGIYEANGRGVGCSIHTPREKPPVDPPPIDPPPIDPPPIDPPPPVLPDKIFKNHEYNEMLSYNQSETYNYGDIVTEGDLIFRCIEAGEKSTNVLDDCTSKNFKNEYAVWEIIGAVKDKNVPFKEGKLYGIGTIINYNGTYYMFAPKDNYRGDVVLNPDTDALIAPENPKWIKLSDKDGDDKEDGGNIKPPRYDNSYKNAIPTTQGMSLIKGQYYTDGKGNIYLYNGNSGENLTIIAFKDVKDGKWDIVENGIYKTENAKYTKGDKIWYKGHYYIAQQDIITVNDGKTLPTNSSSTYWKPA